MLNRLPGLAAFAFFFAAAFVFQTACAQFPYEETFKNKSAKGLVLGGSAVLTANLNAGADPDGDGYLRLTSPLKNQTGYVYAQTAFPSGNGMEISFEFFTYKNPASGQADGISFFLFDASVPSFRIGGTGGALGYTQRIDNTISLPGLAGGYLGIGIDEYGNFSNASDNKKNGGTGRTPGSVTLRGPGNGMGPNDYVFQTNVITANTPHNISFLAFNQRYPDPSHQNYRKIKLVLTPGSSLGANKGYTISVTMYKGATPSPTPVVLFDNYDYPFEAPAKLKYGFAASTGEQTNYHEIRNLTILPAVSQNQLPPSAADDYLTIICEGGQGLLDVTANDQSNNAGSAIAKSRVDLDAATAGEQKSYTDAGKGTYTVDENGIVKFVAESGFWGHSTIAYTVADEYGVVSNNAHLLVTVNQGTPPDLTVADPPAVCFPQTVDITQSGVANTSTSGAVLNYFASLSDANAGINSINTSAHTISSSGTYYISAAMGSCITTKPLVVTINQAPTTANAGPDFSLCNRTTSNLAGNTPVSGEGTWTQISGPATAGISTPYSSNTPITGLLTGTYVFRWTVSSGACPSSADDIQITNLQAPTTSNAGSSQVLCNASSAVLQANTPAVGTGMWSQVGTPAVSIQSPESPTATVSGLTTGNAYTFKWTISSSGCAASTSQVTITNNVNTLADAGADQLITNVNTFTLSANAPNAGNAGNWSLQGAPAGHTVQIEDPAHAQSRVSGLDQSGEYTFRWTVTNSSCGASNFDEMKLVVSTTLPIRLLSFTGFVKEAQVHLKWEAGEEAAGDYFMVERSFDGVAFTGIKTVQAGPLPLNQYAYSEEATLFAANPLYYRLKMMHADGTYTYSNVLMLLLKTAGKESEINISPNPFSREIRVSLQAYRMGLASIRLYNAKGVLVYVGSEKVTTGKNELYIRNLAMLPRGIYFLELVWDNNQQREKLVKW